MKFKQNVIATLICLLSFFVANSNLKAQLFQQQFSTNAGTIMSTQSSSTVITGNTYFNNTSPTNGQFNYCQQGSTGQNLVSDGNKLSWTRAGGSSVVYRSTNLAATAPTSLILRFDYEATVCTGSGSVSPNVYIGTSFPTSSSNNPTGTNIAVTVPILVKSGATPSFGISANTVTTGEKTVYIYTNNSGSTINYKAPNGTYTSLATGKYTIWLQTGATTWVNDLAPANLSNSVALQNFGFRLSSGTETFTLDNILVDPIPATPTSSAASSIGANNFTANWSTVTGVTGYRLDVATDAGFTSMVSGYDNLYVSGQATNSKSITGLGSGIYYYRVRAASQYTVDEFASGNSSTQTATIACVTPTVNSQPSSSAQSTCVNGTLASFTYNVSGASSYQWYSNSSNSNSGGTLIVSATSATYTPLVTSASSLYYYCVASAGASCDVTSNTSGLITVNAIPTPTFTAAPTGTVGVDNDLTYTTEAGQSSYVWTFTGTLGVDYSITSGGTGASNTVTLKWLTPGSKTVTINYTNSNSCTAASATSAIVTASATVFHNKPSSDVTVLSNWGTALDGTGAAPTNFTDDNQTFNVFNSGATMSTSWDVQGVGSKVVIGDGVNPLTFTATSAFTSTIVNVRNLGNLVLQTTTIPTFGTIFTGSTITYAGTAITQVVTPTAYSNLVLNGTGTRSFSGTTNISGTFTTGSGFAATAGTIVLNGTSSSQAIPAFSYNGLTVSGIDGKSTSGSISVAGTLTMSNSFSLSSGHTLYLDSTSSMSSASGKVLTVNGTLQKTYNYNGLSFSAGSGSITVAAGGTFAVTGYTGANGTLTFTNVNFTNGIGAAGSTISIRATGVPRLPASPTIFNGNVEWNIPTMLGAQNMISATPYTITGNLSVVSTGTGVIAHAGGSSGRSLTVNGNLSVTNGSRYHVAGDGATTFASTTSNLTVNGDVTLNGSGSELFATNTVSAASTAKDTIFIKGNLYHTNGSIGKATTAVTSVGVISFNGSSNQSISSLGVINSANVVLNNPQGAVLSSNFSVSGNLALTNGILRTNGYTLTLADESSSITAASFGSNTSSYIAICDNSGTTSTTGGVKIDSIGVGGRTGAILFPIGSNLTSYNPITVTNSNTANSYTVRVNTNPLAGIVSDSAVQRTWNVQAANSGSATTLAMQWVSSEEGSSFTKTSASVAHYNAGTSSIDLSSNGANASGSDPYTISSGLTSFSNLGDFGVTNGVVILATKPTVQASNVATSTTVTTMDITWTKGTDAAYSLVVVKPLTAVNGNPANATSYNDGGNVFGSGTQIGTGNYVVYAGTGNFVTVSGLTQNTLYHVAVYSFNGTSGSENYLTTSPATANESTDVPTYYYVGGAGGTTSSTAWNTANRWATTYGGTPLSGFTPSNTDVYIFDGNNLGTTASPYTGAVGIAAIATGSSIGKIVLQNNATINLYSTSSSTTMAVGNSSNTANTNVLSIPSGSTLSLLGSTNIVSLQNNSSASVSGTLNLGQGTGNFQLLPGTNGSSIALKNGAICQVYQATNATFPFGTSGSGVVAFDSGSTFISNRSYDAFGGAGNSVSTFAPGSLYWIGSANNSSNLTLDGKVFGDLRIDNTTLSPVGSSNGFTVYNLNITAGTTTIAATGTNNHIKGNVTIASGAILKLSPASTATLNFSGTAAQTITNNGAWTVNSSTTTDQSYVVSNTAGLSLAGKFTLAGLAGTSMTVNSGCNLNLQSDTLTMNAGTLNIAGTLSRTSGTVKATTSGSTVNVTGASSLPANVFVGDSVRNFIINRSGGVTLNDDVRVVTNLSLLNGTLSTGSNKVMILSGASVTRTNGWVNGNLQKYVSSGSNVARTFEIGDATNYTPVSMIFASVSAAGDLLMKTNSPLSTQPNIATAPVGTSAYINRYWSLNNASTLAFTNFKGVFNYVSSDLIGGATSTSVVSARYSTSWSKSTPISVGTYADSVNTITTLGDFIFANDCVTVTPTVSIASTSTSFCTGSSATFTATPTNGGSSPSYQWKNNGNNIGINSATLILNAANVANGNVITCVMTANNVCQTTATATSNGLTLTVGGTVTPSVTISTASDTICSGSVTTFSANANNGGSSPSFQWKRNGNNVGSASSIQFAGGSLGTGDIISCVLTANNVCQTTATANSNTITLNVKPSPAIGTSSSVTTFCTLGSIKPIYNTNTANGGLWVSSNPSIASVATASNGASGAITANANGTANITYTKTGTNGCVSTSNAVMVTVAAVTTPEVISGTNSICIGNTTSLSTSSTGGVWSSSNNRGSISNGGVYTGTNGGAGEARYTVTNGSGCSAYASYAITVNSYPNIPTINYAPGTVNPQYGAPSGSFCSNKTFTVVGTPTGGVWSKTGVISVTSPAGVVSTGSTLGAGSLTYTITVNGCSSSRTIAGNVVACAARGVSMSNEQLVNSSEITMFPNPAKSVINLQVDKLIGAGSIVITDLYGKTVKNQNLSMGTNTVDIANLSKGMYFVSTITNEGKATKKLVVE